MELFAARPSDVCNPPATDMMMVVRWTSCKIQIKRSILGQHLLLFIKILF